MFALFLALLVLYVLLGVPSVSFHGDEAMQIYMSSDYATVFFDRAPERLLSFPPFAIDSDAHLRLINGTVNRYLIGLSWHLGGYPRESLPPRPGWDWGLSYADNLATGHRPAPDFMTAARASSALLTGAAVLLMFAIGWRVGGAPAAILACLIFALHPVVLVNGRRAMQEGSMLAFGLLTVYAALLIVSAGGETRRRAGIRWTLLAAAGVLTLASKHSGVIFLAAAYAWVAVDAAW
ncbi:MAG: phospholipid carrier-dependent glycosyltransferase, partial [Anaerolineae bacterium]|nr:phospholipid carrier-dependent glycosyltransferase [Anaerolineae bacterium]